MSSLLGKLRARLSIVAHSLRRHALSTTMPIGVVVSLVFYWITMGVLTHLFVESGA